VEYVIFAEDERQQKFVVEHPQAHLLDTRDVEREPSVQFPARPVSDDVSGVGVESGQGAEHELAQDVDNLAAVESRTAVAEFGFSEFVAQASIDLADLAGLEHGFHKDAEDGLDERIVIEWIIDRVIPQWEMLEDGGQIREQSVMHHGM
jgi:hypothetical protein